MKLRLFLSFITIFVASTRLNALVGEVVDGAGEVVADVGRGISNLGEAITGTDYVHDGDYYIANDVTGRPVRYYKAHREGRPALYIKPVAGQEEIYLDGYTGYDPKAGEYYHSWKEANPS